MSPWKFLCIFSRSGRSTISLDRQRERERERKLLDSSFAFVESRQQKVIVAAESLPRPSPCSKETYQIARKKLFSENELADRQSSTMHTILSQGNARNRGNIFRGAPRTMYPQARRVFNTYRTEHALTLFNPPHWSLSVYFGATFRKNQYRRIWFGDCENSNRKNKFNFVVVLFSIIKPKAKLIANGHRDVVTSHYSDVMQQLWPVIFIKDRNRYVTGALHAALRCIEEMNLLLIQLRLCYNCLLNNINLTYRNTGIPQYLLYTQQNEPTREQYLQSRWMELHSRPNMWFEVIVSCAIMVNTTRKCLVLKQTSPRLCYQWLQWNFFRWLTSLR